MADKKDILEILGLISVAYPNFKMAQSGDASTADAYMAFLGDIPADLLKLAVIKCCAESGRAFAPSVGEIRGAVGEIQRKAQGIPSALAAWDEICNAPMPYPSDPDYVVYYINPPTAYRWSHPLVEKTAKQLGWPNFPRIENGKFENEIADRAHFFKQYEAASQNNTTEMMELPQVTKYIQGSEEIKKLTDRMKK